MPLPAPRPPPLPCWAVSNPTSTPHSLAREWKGCHGDRALFKAQEWSSLLFRVLSCEEKTSVTVVFHMCVGLEAPRKVACPSGSRGDGEWGRTFVRRRSLGGDPGKCVPNSWRVPDFVNRDWKERRAGGVSQAWEVVWLHVFELRSSVLLCSKLIFTHCCWSLGFHSWTRRIEPSPPCPSGYFLAPRFLFLIQI